jgi:CheY-like chemotaxis protein
MTQAPEKWRLLLVDDEKDIRNVPTIALTDLGYGVLCAQNGHEALGLYREQRPPIVLTDIKMPGIGMKSETREKIFDLFFSSKGSKGTGFGLFITRNIVAQHGGTISVASTKGRGSIFIIRVPAPDVQGDNRHAPPGRELIVNPNVA